MMFCSCSVTTTRFPLEGNCRRQAPDVRRLVGQVREVDDAHARRRRGARPRRGPQRHRHPDVDVAAAVVVGHGHRRGHRSGGGLHLVLRGVRERRRAGGPGDVGVEQGESGPGGEAGGLGAEGGRPVGVREVGPDQVSAAGVVVGGSEGPRGDRRLRPRAAARSAHRRSGGHALELRDGVLEDVVVDRRAERDGEVVIPGRAFGSTKMAEAMLPPGSVPLTAGEVGQLFPWLSRTVTTWPAGAPYEMPRMSTFPERTGLGRVNRKSFAVRPRPRMLVEDETCCTSVGPVRRRSAAAHRDAGDVGARRRSPSHSRRSRSDPWAGSRP